MNMTTRAGSGHVSRAWCVLLAAVVAGALLLAGPPAQGRVGDEPAGTPVFEAGMGGYDTFRIPAIITTPDGTVLAFAEGRREGASDHGDIDLVLRRSTSNGNTWGPLQVVGDNGPNTFGNPAPVVDTQTGDIVLLSTHNAGHATEQMIREGDVSPAESRRVFVQRSSDDGRTWSEPRDITSSVKLPDWRWYATGPGHAIQLQHGAHRGRLVVAANHSAAPDAGSTDTGNEDKYYGAHLVYSDDGGHSWQLGGIDRPETGFVNPNENTVAELGDGRLYLNARDQNGSSAPNRAVTYSSDGGQTFDAPYRPDPQIVAPVVQGSTLHTSERGDSDGRLIFAAPSHPEEREGMAIRSSHDEGGTWSEGTVVWHGPSGYSDLTQLRSGAVGLLYEAGVENPYESITFHRLRVGALD